MRVNRTYRRRYRYKNTIIILITTVSLFGAAGYASYRFFGNVDKVAFDNDKSIEVISPIETQPKSSDEVKAPVKPVLPNSQEVLLSSVGDCTIGWDDKFSYEGSLAQVFKNSESGYSYFFKNVTDIFKADDITTANLETTFTNATVKASKEYTFKAPPEYAEALTLGSIEGVTIANNHTRDYLDQGLNDTKTALDAKNINYFGEGEKWITNVKGHNFGFLGYKGFAYDKNFLKNLKNDIAALKKQNAVVVINFHWGDEGSYYPNSIQKYLAHYAIDNGADLIIGHHPHVIQGIEKYNGKLIAYSLGNFCFGGNRNPKDKDTFILQTKFNFENEKLKAYEVRIIPCSVSSVSNLNDYSPTPLEGSKKEEVIQRINKLSPDLDFELNDEFFFIDVNN